MKNYYEILGVPENASREEIRNAYRELVKKYHPDQYRDNPLSDLAQEKMKEINEAYDYLMNHRQDSAHRSNNQYGYQTNGDQGFQKVRSFIQTGNLEAASTLLNSLDRNQAEWYYLSGIIALNKGWYQQAFTNLQTALRMDPGNPEYAAAWNNMHRTNDHYQAAARHHGSGNSGLCELCTCLYCTDCCCECFGGDFIECC